MTLYRKDGRTYVTWLGEPINSVRHPTTIETAWSAEDLAAIGLYQPTPAGDVPEGKVSTGVEVKTVDGRPAYVHQLRARTLAEASETARQLVAAHVDAVAATRGYDNGAACASYTTSTMAKWAAEATAFVAWRDGVWTKVFDLLAKVQAGTATVPTAAALIASLDDITWPA